MNILMLRCNGALTHLDLKFWCQYIQQLSNKLFLSEVELKSTTISKMYFYAKCMIQIGREKEEVGHQGWAKSVIFSKYYVHFLKIPIEAKLILKIIFFRQEHRSISGSVFFKYTR